MSNSLRYTRKIPNAKMEDSFSNITHCSQRENGRTNATEESGPDDLTNLNWVAGIPVPMNTSVSPPEGSRAKKLFSGSSSTKNLLAPHQKEPGTSNAPNFGVPVGTKSLKTQLPTYKIVVKDHASDSLQHANNSSPEKRDSVILANIVPSGSRRNGNGKSGFECDKILVDDDEVECIEVEKEIVGGFGATEAPIVVEEEEESAQNDKPNCSYTCLIGMALKASAGCLPVNAIYQYIEREFPYFITAPDGWKNSVRHNLSLNPIFRKVNREGWTGKKGYLWEVSPDKQGLVDKEILRFLHTTGKKLGEFTAPMKASCIKYKQRSKKPNRALLSNTPIFCSRCTRIVSPTLQESSASSDDSCTHIVNSEEIKKYSIEMQEEAMASEVQVKHIATATQSVFDAEKKPSNYIGVKSPPADPKEVAREIFSLCPSPEASNQFYSPMNYSGPFFPLYAQPSQFGIPYENFEVVSSSSPSSSGTSPNANGTMAAAMLPPQYHQYAMPVPFHYFLGSQYPQIYSPNIAGDCSDDTPPKLIAPQPVSVKVLSSSSDQVNTEGAGMSYSENHSQKSGVKKGSTDYSCYGYSAASLSSPLKKMKVIDDPMIMDRSADENISAYFADVSANSTCSDDDDAEENAEVSSIMSLLLKSEQQQRQQNPALPLAGLGQITVKEKEHLEQITGTSDLSVLLDSGLEMMKKKGEKINSTEPPPPDMVPQNKHTFSNECAGILSMDIHDIDSKATASQDDSYFLPSLDSLLNIGEDTIVTMKAAMNLDIQGVVEIATEDSNKELVDSKLNVALPSTK